MTRNVYWSRPSVCLSLVACPHYSTVPDVTWGMVEGDGSARCARSVIYDCLVMAAHSNGQAIILLPYGSFYLLLLSFALALSQRPLVRVHPPPFPSNRHNRSNGDCLEGKRENYQVCSVQYCVQRLCTVQCTHVNGPNSSLDLVLSHWAHFTVLRFIFVYVLLPACV